MRVLKSFGFAAVLAVAGLATVAPSAQAMSYAQCLSTLMREGYSNHSRTPLGIRIKAAYIVCEQFGV